MHDFENQPTSKCAQHGAGSRRYPKKPGRPGKIVAVSRDGTGLPPPCETSANDRTYNHIRAGTRFVINITCQSSVSGIERAWSRPYPDREIRSSLSAHWMGGGESCEQEDGELESERWHTGQLT